jgi:hypothetical protein
MHMDSTSGSCACVRAMAMAQIRMPTCGVDVSACDGMGLVHNCVRTSLDVCDDRGGSAQVYSIAVDSAVDLRCEH